MHHADEHAGMVEKQRQRLTDHATSDERAIDWPVALKQ